MPSREVSAVVEQTIAPGASGSITMGIPLVKVDIRRDCRKEPWLWASRVGRDDWKGLGRWRSGTAKAGAPWWARG